MRQLISVTKNAFSRLIQIQKKHQVKYISFGVRSGGCSGFQYQLQPCSQKIRTGRFIYSGRFTDKKLKRKIHFYY